MRIVLTSGNWRYTVSPDAPIPAGGLASAIVFARVIDECTQLPPETRLAIETSVAGLTPRSSDGFVGLSAIPRAVFSRLATQAYNIPLEIRGDRYLPVRRTAVLGPQAGFPNSFAPVDLGQIEMHSQPVVIRGRITEASGADLTPVAGAAVRVTGIWRALPPANAAPPPAPPNVISLRPGVYFDRTAAAGRVRRREMAPVAGDARTLLEQARAGATTLRVSNRTGIAAGAVLRVNSAPNVSEFMTVQNVAGASTPDQPATVTLTYALRNDHAPATEVVRVNPQPPGADIALQADTIPGDVCVLLTSMAAIVPAAVIEIHGGPQPAEYHLASRFETASDAAGFYRLPPLSRVAQLDIEVDDGVHPPQTQNVTPAYGLLENRVDFSFV